MATAMLVDTSSVVERMKLRTKEIAAPAKAREQQKTREQAEEAQRLAEEASRRLPLVIIISSSRTRSGFGQKISRPR